MRSNGFGSSRQKIVVNVDAGHCEEVAKKLCVSGFKKQGKPERAYFEWARFTTRRGDDEDVVWHLSLLLGAGVHDGWEIDWDSSEY
ncbi:hypothetical protein [Ensifer canadensis]